MSDLRYSTLLICSDIEEERELRDIYPGLLDDVNLVYAPWEVKRIQGRRFNRVFVGYTADSNSPAVCAAWQSLVTNSPSMIKAPIFLMENRRDYRRWFFSKHRP